MKEKGKDAKGMSEIRIDGEILKTEPKYKATAPALLAMCREFYQKEENEKAFMDSTRKGCGSE